MIPNEQNSCFYISKTDKMAEGCDYKGLRESPELFRTILRNVVEEIVAGTRKRGLVLDANLLESSNNKQSLVLRKTMEFLQESVKKSVFESIDTMWSDTEINEKMLVLTTLEQKYPEDFTAWRPSTGDIPMSTLRGRYLTKLKDRLTQKTEQCKIEAEKLKKELEVKKNALKISNEKIIKAEDHLNELYNEYEELMQKAYQNVVVNE